MKALTERLRDDHSLCNFFLVFTVFVSLIGAFNLAYMVMPYFGIRLGASPYPPWPGWVALAFGLVCAAFWLVGVIAAISHRKWFLCPILAMYVLVAAFYCIGGEVNNRTFSAISEALGVAEYTRPVTIDGTLQSADRNFWISVWQLSLVISVIAWLAAALLAIVQLTRSSPSHLRKRILVLVTLWALFAPAAVTFIYPAERMAIAPGVWLSGGGAEVIRAGARIGYPALCGFAAGLFVVFALCSLAGRNRASIDDLVHDIERQDLLLLVAVVVVFVGVVRLYLLQQWIIAGLPTGAVRTSVIAGFKNELIFTGVYYSAMFFFAFLPTMLLNRLDLQGRRRNVKDPDKKRILAKYTVSAAVERLALRLGLAISPFVVACVGNWTFPS